MEMNDLLALVRAGYTKSEISALTSQPFIVPSSEEPTGPAAATADPAPVPEEKPAAPAAAPAPVVDNSEVLAALKELTKTIQKNAILRDDLRPAKQETATDILGKIINPTGNN